MNVLDYLKKEEIIDALRSAKGIEGEPTRKKIADVGSLKADIRALKLKRRQAVDAKDRKMATIYRRKIARLKKKTRRAVAAS